MIVIGTDCATQVSLQRTQVDQPDLADFDRLQLFGAQQPPKVLGVVSRYLCDFLDGDVIVNDLLGQFLKK